MSARAERRIVVHGIGGGVREASSDQRAPLRVERFGRRHGHRGPAEAVAPSKSGPSAAEHQALHLKLPEDRRVRTSSRSRRLNSPDLDAVLNLFSLSVMGQFGVERLALFLADPDHEGHRARGPRLQPASLRDLPPDARRASSRRIGLRDQAPPPPGTSRWSAATRKQARPGLQLLRRSGQVGIAL